MIFGIPKSANLNFVMFVVFKNPSGNCVICEFLNILVMLFKDGKIDKKSVGIVSSVGMANDNSKLVNNNEFLRQFNGTYVIEVFSKTELPSNKLGKSENISSEKLPTLEFLNTPTALIIVVDELNNVSGNNNFFLTPR